MTETKKHLTVRTITMTALLSAAAYLLAFIEFPVPLEQVIAAFSEFMPFIQTKLDVVIYNAFPFNFIKGLVIGSFTMIVYKRLSPVLKGASLS